MVEGFLTEPTDFSPDWRSGCSVNAKRTQIRILCGPFQKSSNHESSVWTQVKPRCTEAGHDDQIRSAGHWTKKRYAVRRPRAKSNAHFIDPRIRQSGALLKRRSRMR